MPVSRRDFLQKLTGGIGAFVVLSEIAHAGEATSGTSTTIRMPYFASGTKLLIAHRGASSYAPENTLPAYRMAIKQGADLVEQDLQISRDSVLMCCHDVSLERVTNIQHVFPDRFTTVLVKGKPVKQWKIHDFTLKELKTLDAGSHFNPKFKGTTIPTWQEAIDEIRGKAGLCPETKGPEYYGKLGFNMEKLVAEVLKKNSLSRADPKSHTPILMQSFSRSGLLRLQKDFGIDWPVLWLGFVGTKWTVEKLADAKSHCAAVGPYKGDITPELVTQAHKMGLKVIGYTFEPNLIKSYETLPAEMNHYLYDLKIDGLFTNNPDQFPRKPLS